MIATALLHLPHHTSEHQLRLRRRRCSARPCTRLQLQGGLGQLRLQLGRRLACLQALCCRGLRVLDALPRRCGLLWSSASNQASER